jgi:nicotinate-nucleotide pyrophosphorylase (carboxylating)
VTTALEEDGAFRDVTTLSLVPAAQQGRGVFLAKDQGVIAGLSVAAATFAAVDGRVKVRFSINDGDWVEDRQTFGEIEGPLGAILSAERVALNFLQRMSGTATLTRALVDAVAGTQARIVDTRKTTPGLRPLERYAVAAGGGGNHRYNLSDGVLIKDNHIAAGRAEGMSIPQIIAAARAGVPHTMRIEIEVTTYEEAEEAVAGGADIILLDNMDAPEMARCVRMINGRALTEASGGITVANARAIADTGVDIMSSGSVTHSAKSLDISLNVENA